MGIMQDMKLKKEKDTLVTDVVNTVDKYFLSHNIPLRAFYPDSKARKNFYNGSSDWLMIKLEPNNTIWKLGYNALRTIKDEKKEEQEALNNEDILKDIVKVLNEKFPKWYFGRITRDSVEFAIMIDVSARKR